MPRSDDDSPHHRRRKDVYRSRDSRSTSNDRRESRDRDRHRHRDSGSRRRSISSDRRKSRDRSPTSHASASSQRSKRRSTSRHRTQSDYKSSRHRRNRSSSSSSSSEKSEGSSRSKSRSRKRSSSIEIVTKFSDLAPSRTINLESATNEDKRRQLIDEIDADSFEPKTFKTTKKVSEKVIIDLQNQTISVPQVESKGPDLDQIIHPSFLGNDDERMEKWVRKLFVYRQRHSDQA